MKSDQELQTDDRRRNDFARAIETADAKHARTLQNSLRKMGDSLPFRKDERSREQFIADVLRLSRLAGLSSRRKKERYQQPHFATSCDPGWRGAVQASDSQYPGTSPSYSIPAVESGPPLPGFAGISKRCFPTAGSISIGAAIGEWADLQWTPPGQRIEMGVYEGASASGSAFTFYDLTTAVSTRAPHSLMTKVDVFNDQSAPFMMAGSPAEPGGGLVWCWAQASLDVYIGLNLTGGAILPQGHDEVCIFNRMGSPDLSEPNGFDNGVNGNWGTQITSFDDGDPSEHTLVATIGGTNLPDRIVTAIVSIDIVCLRYPGSIGFAGLDYSDYTLYPPIVTVPSGPPTSAPIRLGPFKVCGI
jgi:hypothetical protein